MKHYTRSHGGLGCFDGVGEGKVKGETVAPALVCFNVHEGTTTESSIAIILYIAPLKSAFPLLMIELLMRSTVSNLLIIFTLSTSLFLTQHCYV